MYRYLTGGFSYTYGFRGMLTDSLQINATWEPTQSVCTVTNPESSKMTIIATLATDVILLLTMLVGVLRLRQNCTSLALVKLLWRQVSTRSSRPL